MRGKSESPRQGLSYIFFTAIMMACAVGLVGMLYETEVVQIRDFSGESLRQNLLYQRGPGGEPSAESSFITTADLNTPEKLGDLERKLLEYYAAHAGEVTFDTVYFFQMGSQCAYFMALGDGSDATFSPTGQGVTLVYSDASLSIDIGTTLLWLLLSAVALFSVAVFMARNRNAAP